jgi:hypothetical protein
MSSPADSKAAAVVVPNGADGAKDAAMVTPMAGGGGVISPLPYAGGKRKSRRLSKKVLKMLKKMGPAKVAKMVKKGGDDTGMGEGSTDMEGARRRRSGKKTRRYSRRR